MAAMVHFSRAIDIDFPGGSGTDRSRYDVLPAGPQSGVAFRF